MSPSPKPPTFDRGALEHMVGNPQQYDETCRMLAAQLLATLDAARAPRGKVTRRFFEVQFLDGEEWVPDEQRETRKRARECAALTAQETGCKVRVVPVTVRRVRRGT